MYYLKISEKQNKINTLSFTSLPVKKKSYTLQRAPMAHKTNSKEHFKFKFFFFKITFKAFIKNSDYLISVNNALFFLLTLKPFFPVFETNLLFLKSYRILFFIKNKKSFKYLML
jgi:hypothetical protein|tara:strand:- start:219 stop:560 length:342 start_codon:yes stop_codon:yes gene_type:complete